MKPKTNRAEPRIFRRTSQSSAATRLISRTSAIARAELKKAGKTQDEAMQIITDEMSAQYPDKNRLAGAIRAGYSNEAP